VSKTVESGSPYLTAAQYIYHRDARPTGDLARDDGTRLDPGSLAGDPTIEELLGAASGELESACGVGRRYTPADLAELSGNSAAYLRHIIAGLAYGYLLDRRGDPSLPVPAFVTAARDALERLKEGTAIFGFLETELAGQAKAYYRKQRQIDQAALFTNDPGVRRFLGRSKTVSPLT
jgi:hypothetical protein